MCPDDGYVAFYASELVSGYLEKSLLGGGAKSSLFAVLLRDSSAEASALTMGRLAKLTSRFLMDYGFSIGIVDVQPTPRLTEEKAKLLARGYLQCKESTPHHPLLSPPLFSLPAPSLPFPPDPRPSSPLLPPPILPPPRQDKTDAFNSGNLAPSPGCTMEQTLESEMNGLLSKIRDDAGEICKRELHHLNAPLTMARCGSKGSFINISQMIACVGQQSVGGKRMPNGFVHRALPHFPRHSLEPAGVHLPQVASPAGCISRRLHLPRMTSLSASECVWLPL